MVTGISPDNDAFLNQVVATGLFPTREAAIDEAVRRLRAQYPPSEPVRSKVYASTEEWLAAFHAWRERCRDVTAIADDSRESIY